MKGITISTKMALGSLLVGVVVIGLAAYSYVSMRSIDNGVNDLYTNRLQPLHTLGDIDTGLHQLENLLLRYALLPEERSATRAAFDAEQAAIGQILADYQKRPLSSQERDGIAEVASLWAAYSPELAKAFDRIDASAQADSGAVLHDSAAEDRRTAIDTALEALLDHTESMAAATNQQSQQTMAQATWLLAVVTLVALLVAVGIALAISRNVVRSVNTVNDAAQAFAAGDLARRVEIHSGDELEALGNSFNQMADRIQQQIETQRDARQTLEKGTEEINAASTEILAAVSQHTASANEQSAAINQVSATVSEAQASSQQAAAKAAEVAELATDAMRVGQDGADSVDAILHGMQDIRSKVESIAENILALSEQTQQIGDIIASVTDIADQSNILAINAAIEAAKAGEQGRGFAVVAGEVRNLAEQSKQATAKVRSILVDIQKATNSAVLATEQGTRGVESGVGLTQSAGKVITQLTTTIRSAAQSSQQIAAASRQQSIAMDQIVQAMREINQATVQFVAGARQSESAAQGLNDLSRDLLALANRYEA